MFKEAKLKSVFSIFDTEADGFISITNMQNAFRKLGYEFNEEEIEEIMNEHDTQGIGKLSYENFKEIFIIPSPVHIEEP